MQGECPVANIVRNPWIYIGGFFAVAFIGLVVALLMATVFRGPSDADLAVRARMGDQEALKKLEAKYSAPVPEVVTTKEILFVAGTYTEPVGADTLNIGEFVASFLIYLNRGEIDQAAKFMATPAYQQLRITASFFDEPLQHVIAQEGIVVPKEASLTAVNPKQVGDYQQGGYDYIEAGGQKDIPVGHRYYVEGIYAAAYTGIIVTLEIQKDRLTIVSIN